MFTLLRISVALSLAAGLMSPPLAAQEAVPRNLSELEAAGMVYLDDVNTPLLHHVATGAPYDLRVLANGDGNSGYDHPEPQLRNKLASRDEFVRADAMPVWRAFVNQRIATMRQAHSYLIPMETGWGDYDFAQSRYPIKLRMGIRTSFKGGPSYHCKGAFDHGPERHSILTVCLHAVNEDQKDPFLLYFPIESQAVARELRQNRAKFQIFAVAEPVGAYRVLRGNELRRVTTEIITAAGVQPVRITQLILATNQGDIFAISRKASAAPTKAASPIPANSDGTVPAASVAAPPEWMPVARDESSALYVDPESVRREGSIVMIRTMIDLGEHASTGVQSVVSLFANDCGKRSNRQLRRKDFDGRFGKGAVLGDTQEPQAPIVPGRNTFGEKMLNFACNASSAVR